MLKMNTTENLTSIGISQSITMTSHENYVVFNRQSPAIRQSNIQIRITGPLCGDFPVQRDSNAEKASMWWRHHGLLL